ncbi:MAG: hypothetical protein KA436_03730 [Oligoflexales bacterium]|nr:hypothetical protein [Oligoflexales bacterium]
MSEKPKVCVIDENPSVKFGWEKSLSDQAQLDFYQDHRDLVLKAEKDPSLIPSYACIIVGRLYPHIGLDIVQSTVPQLLRQSAKGPVFLNWQGYIVKEELEKKFDGKIFHRYGIKWHTLKLRIQRMDKKKKQSQKPFVLPSSQQNLAPVPKQVRMSKVQRCQSLLKLMASRAEGQHREKIEHYAFHDSKGGVALLEAIYNRLLVDRKGLEGCPSRYINSSPVIAVRILREALN